MPEPVDFESIVRVCRGSGRVMMLKNFLSTFSVQFIFSSYPYEAQRRITRLLLGLSAEGDKTMKTSDVFEPNITLQRPFQPYVLIETLENGVKITQLSKVCQELLENMSSEQF